jgi:D-aspartate ligase
MLSRHRPRTPLACVVGEIDLVRALGLAGIRSAVLTRPGESARFSRFTTTSLDHVDASRDPERLAEALLDFAREQPTRPILYYNADWHLLAISRHRDALAHAFDFVLPEATLVEDLVDKYRFQTLAQRLELPVPAAVRLSPRSDPPEPELGFPIALKQLTRHYRTWEPITSAKALRVSTEGELAKLWPQFAAAGFDVLVQEWIPGPETQIESYHAYLDASGECAGEFTGRKLRTFPRECGYSTALITTRADDVAALGRELLDRLDFRGVAKLDFKRDPRNGRLHLLEINPRFNLWHHVGAKAGVNLPALVYADLVGLPRNGRGTARAGVRWCSVWHDAQAVREEGASLARWLPWVLTCEAKSGIAWDDPVPVLRKASSMFMDGLRALASSRTKRAASRPPEPDDHGRRTRAA